MSEEFYRIKRLPPYVIAEVNGMRAAARAAGKDIIDLGMGTKTRAQIIMERTGGSFEQKHEQLVREQRMRDADGLVTPANASSALQPAQSGGEGANDGGGQPKEGQSQ